MKIRSWLNTRDLVMVYAKLHQDMQYHVSLINLCYKVSESMHANILGIDIQDFQETWKGASQRRSICWDNYRKSCHLHGW